MSSPYRNRRWLDGVADLSPAGANTDSHGSVGSKRSADDRIDQHVAASAPRGSSSPDAGQRSGRAKIGSGVAVVDRREADR